MQEETIRSGDQCCLCREGLGIIAYPVLVDVFVVICVHCFIGICQTKDWRPVSHRCVDCGEEQSSAENLRQIHDALSVKDGLYPIKLVCQPCRDEWWGRVQHALQENQQEAA